MIRVKNFDDEISGLQAVLWNLAVISSTVIVNDYNYGFAY